MKDWTGNGKSIFTTLGASNHTDKAREQHDFYATDPVAIDKLFAVWRPPTKTIWECACGEGHLAERCKAYGYMVAATDIVYRGYGDKECYDFLKAPWTQGGTILTNPPYKFATEFVLHALKIQQVGGYVVMFLKTTFLEGKNRKEKIFDKFPPKYIFQFSERILCAKNAEFERMRRGGGSAVAYAWFVWEKGYQGDTIIKWI